MAKKKVTSNNNTKRKLIALSLLALTLAAFGISYFRRNETLSNKIQSITKQATYNSETQMYLTPEVKGSDGKYRIFTIALPAGWAVKRNEFTSDSYALVFEKGNYRFSIAGPPTDKGICNFAINGDVNPLLELEQREGSIGEIYDQYVTLENKFMDLRFGRIYAELHKSEGFIDFNVCQMNQSFPRQSWAGVTDIGYINLRTPYKYDQMIVDEISNTVSDIQITSK